jgi:hypothetical protein
MKWEKIVYFATYAKKWQKCYKNLFFNRRKLCHICKTIVLLHILSYIFM